MGPASLPATLTQAKQKLRLSLDDSTHDGELARQLASGAEHFEQDTDRAVITQDYQQLRDYFPAYGCAIRLSIKPIQQILSIKYTDPDGNPLEVDSADYIFDAGRREIALVPGASWPTTNNARNNVLIDFRAGYGAAEDVPREILEAILCWTAYLFYGNSPDAEPYRKAYDAMVDPNIRTSYF